MSKSEVETLQQRVLDLQSQVIGLQEQVLFLEKRTDTIFCNECSNKCNREKITCELCRRISHPDREFSEDGLTREAMKKVFICAPYIGDGDPDAIKLGWAKTRAYAQMAFKEGYMPYAPHLYHSLFLDNTSEDDKFEGRVQGTKWIFEVYLAEGEFWICSEPDKRMKLEIRIAESLHMKVKYAYDHPVAIPVAAEDELLKRGMRPEYPAPVTDLVAAAPLVEAPVQERPVPEAKSKPVPLSLAGQPKGNPTDWALRKIAAAMDVESVKKVKNWASRNIPKAEIGKVNFVVGERIKALKAA